MYNIAQRKISIPYTNFLSGTIISPAQVNTNFDEVEYCFNQLYDEYQARKNDTYNKQQVYELETANDKQIKAKSDADYIHFTNKIAQEVLTLNNRITTEKNTLNTRITTEVNTLNTRITNEKSTLNTSISKKGDALELKNTLLYLKSGSSVLSVADLTGLGGGSGRATTLGVDGSISKDYWQHDGELGLYYYDFVHPFSTSSVIPVLLDTETSESLFVAHKVLTANIVRLYTDVATDAYCVILNASNKLELVGAILDDTQITELRTWSSKKIDTELQKLVANMVTDAKSTSFDNSENGMQATNVQSAIDELANQIGANTDNLISRINSVINKLV